MGTDLALALPPCPPHAASKAVAALALGSMYVRWTCPAMIALVQITPDSWAEVKRQVRPADGGIRRVARRIAMAGFEDGAFCSGWDKWPRLNQ